MKSMKKALALGLALALAVTAVPVTDAQAATKTQSKLSKTSTTVVVGPEKQQAKTVKVTANSWKNVKVKAKSSDNEIADVSVSGKNVKVTAKKKGTAKVTVTVTGTGKNTGKAKKESLTLTVKVKGAGARITEVDKSTTAADFTLTTGSTKQLYFKMSPASDATVTAVSNSDPEVASVTTDGTVTALKAGTTDISFTTDYGKTSQTVKVTVEDEKPAAPVLTTAKQTKISTIEATFTGDDAQIAKITKANMTLKNNYTGKTVEIKDAKVSTTDPKKFIVTTFGDMKDGKDYTLSYGGNDVVFTATDGTKAAVILDPETPVYANEEVTLKYVTTDVNGVILDSVANKVNDGTCTAVITVTNSTTDYVLPQGVFLKAVGNTATVSLTYNTGYDSTTGLAKTLTNANITVTAVAKTTATAAGITMKIGTDAYSSYAGITTDAKLKVGDDEKYGYLQLAKSDKSVSNDFSGYTVTSADSNIAYVSSQTTDLANLKKGIIRITPVKAGTTSIIVKDAAGVAEVIPITVYPAAVLTSMTATAPVATTITSSAMMKQVRINVALFDQYGDPYTNHGTLTIENKVTRGSNSAEADVAQFAKGATTTVTNGSHTGTIFAQSGTEAKLGEIYTVTVNVKDTTVSASVNIEVIKAGTPSDLKFVRDDGSNSKDAVVVNGTDTTITGYVYVVDNNKHYIDVLSGGSIDAAKSQIKGVKVLSSGGWGDAAVNDGVAVVNDTKWADGSNSAGKVTITLTKVDPSTDTSLRRVATGTMKVYIATKSGIGTGALSQTSIKVDDIVVRDSEAKPTPTIKAISNLTNHDLKNAIDVGTENTILGYYKVGSSALQTITVITDRTYVTSVVVRKKVVNVSNGAATTTYTIVDVPVNQLFEP